MQYIKIECSCGRVADLSADKFDNVVQIERPDGPKSEKQFESISKDQLGTEWMWETSPEISLVIVDTVDEAILAKDEYNLRIGSDFNYEPLLGDRPPPLNYRN